MRIPPYCDERMKAKYLLFYLKTGGGHFAPAKSVCEYVQERYSEQVDPVLVDGLSRVRPAVRYLMEDGYRILQSDAQWFYKLLYLMNKLSFIADLNRSLVAHFVRPFLEELILREKPEKIIIFHFFLIKPIQDIIRGHRLSVRVMTVVTDPFTAHPLWFVEKNTDFIVFSDDLKRFCVARGISAERISVFPFVLDRRFSRPLSSDAAREIRERLGFDPVKKIVLIMGGGDGIPRGKAILKHIVRSNPGAEIAMVCGRNGALLRRTSAWVRKHGYDHVKIYGYVDFAYEILNISDIVVTKCGASMFMQVLMAGKVPIVSNYLWGQEKGNVEFLEQKRIGFYEKRVKMLPRVIHEMMNDSALTSSLRKNIEHAGIENGVARVSDFIIGFNGV